MLTPDYLAGVSAPMQDIYADLQTNIEADIARRIKKAGYTTDTAAWEIEKLKQMGASQAYITRRVASLTGKTQLEMHDMFTAAGIKSNATDEATRSAMLASGREPANAIPLSANPAFRQIMEANLKRTRGTLQKLTGTMATDAAGQLNKYMDQAQLLVQSGAFTQQQAIDMTVNKFANDGIHAFDYASGARTSIEAAVRRALVTGVNQATAQVSVANCQVLGTDLVEVTSHGDARPEHAAWQGGIYSLNGYDKKHRSLAEATGYGTGSGLCGWNCRHSFYAFVEGVSEALPKEKYDPKIYEAEQKQRYNERMIREWKRKANTLKEGGSDPAKAEAKVREWQTKQRQHVLDNDLARMYDREKVYGMGTLPPIVHLPKPVIPAAPVPKVPTLEELAAAKRDATLAASRERTRAWREGKKTALETAKEAAARLAEEARVASEEMTKRIAEAAKAAEDAAAEAAKVAEARAFFDKWKIEEAAAAKKEALRAASKERTRLWRESKKAVLPSPAEVAAKKIRDAEAVTRAAKEAALKDAVERLKAEDAEKVFRETAAKTKTAETWAAKRAKEKAKLMATAAPADKLPGKVVSYEHPAGFGEPGTYEVWRSPRKSVPTDGITAFHALPETAGISDAKSYYIVTKKPLVIEGSTKAIAREKAFKELTGKASATYHGDVGEEVARQMKAKGYDAIIYKLPESGFEIDPIDFKMAEASPFEKAKEAATEATKKLEEAAAAKKAIRDAADARIRAADDARKAAAEAKKNAAEAAARAADRKARGLKGVDNLKDGKIPSTLENFEQTRDANIKAKFNWLRPAQIEKVRTYTEKAIGQSVARSRIDADTMKMVMTDGKFKTQIELQYERDMGKNVKVTSGGMNAPDSRRKASMELFGTKHNVIDRRDFEYYGYMFDDDFAADFMDNGPRSYGSSTVQYKASVRGRTTFTCGDSLGNSYVPSYVEDITPSWADYDTLNMEKPTHAHPKIKDLLKDSGSSYIENQVHGGVTLDDIESFVYGPDDLKYKGIDKAMVKALNERGIKVGMVTELPSPPWTKTFRWLTEADWT